MTADAIVLQLTRIADALEAIAAGGQLSRRRHIPGELVRALEGYFGDGVFTVAGIMDLVESDPYHPLADAVERVVDMKLAPKGRATKLGQVIAGCSDLELVDTRRGAGVYRVARD